MQYIVRVWASNCDGAQYYEYAKLEDAVALAEFCAGKLKDSGADYDVMIYEATSY